MRAKLASTGGLLAAAVAFVATYLLTSSLIVAPLVGVAAAIGVYLMLDSRTSRQVLSDGYDDDADRKVADALEIVNQIRKLSKDMTSGRARASLQSACDSVPELLARVKANSPNSLYSSASQIGGHLQSLLGVARQYLDIQRKPGFYTEPATLLRNGEEAFRRFADFALDSVRLVNQGDLATYKANLETVAPPTLPQLGETT
jgi:hypothetical protein